MNSTMFPTPVLRQRHPEPTQARTVDSPWTSLYRLAGVAALAQVALIVIQVPIFLLHPPPATVVDFFTLFQQNWLLGLLNLDVLMLVNAALMFPLLLAFYVILRRSGEALMAIALMLGITGNALGFAWNGSFTMLALSDQYAQATTEADRAMFLAAGQAVLTTHMSGTAFNVFYIFSSVTFLIIAAVMLRDTYFGKATAYLGLLIGALTLIPPTVGTLGLYLSIIVLVPTMIWCVLVARRLFYLR